MQTKLLASLLIGFLLISGGILFANPTQKSKISISLKTPGNPAVEYLLQSEKQSETDFKLNSKETIPVQITQRINSDGGNTNIVVTIVASEDIYFNYSQKTESGFSHADCQFYMPGFWYRHNLRSPKEAPSFHTSDSWTVREDRLSSPLTGIFNEKSGNFVTVARVDKFSYEALTTHKSGEVIVSGKTSLGYTGFENINGMSYLSFGFPYRETPKSYIRKLTLIDPVTAFQYLKKGESISLTWQIFEGRASNFSSFVEKAWQYSFDLYQPQIVITSYTPDVMKNKMTNYFTESFVDKYDLKYMSGVELRTDLCEQRGIAEVGFVGRTLLNAFNALEYGEQKNRTDLISESNAIFDSYLKHGVTDSGFFKEVVNYDKNTVEKNLSIRRQSEGIYAMLYYLQYEKKQGRKHPEWEIKLKNMLSQILKLQKPDGSFPRKFKDDFSIIDNSGGSTPSATPMLVLASQYFKDKTYLESAKKTANYLESEIISKADYFSSTLDANCEDKEASYYASTALYHLALFSKGKEKQHYVELAKKAAYFAVTWYYLWDVPFAQGQMLGDVGLKTRGWGNVSVENNHIDVYIFELNSVLKWLAKECDEKRFETISNVIETSMCQLLPTKGHMCDIAKEGYYPEVVQHTNWDYGRNGKGFYNDIFAPGWTVASLWVMLTPDRINLFRKIN